MNRHRIVVIGSAAALVTLGPAGAAQGGGGGHDGHGGHGGHHEVEVIEIQDDCHPPTFNTEIVPGVEFCDPDFDGDTTASEFFAEIAEDGEVGKWRFHPDDEEIDPGTALHAVNVGGELHTFTPVEKFGGGCIPDPRLDIGEPPVAECEGFNPLRPDLHPTAVPSGGRLVVEQEKFFQRYECLIHPWMRAVVTVDRHH